MPESKQHQIRKLSLDDLASLQTLASKTFLDTFGEFNTPEDMQFYLENSLSLAQLKSELENPNSHFFGIHQDERLVAYLKLNNAEAQTENKLENALEIERIYVDSEFLGQRLGKRLFEFSMSDAKERGKEWLWLGVWDQNYHAIEFYKRQGFTKFGEHDFLLGKDEQVDYLYKLAV